VEFHLSRGSAELEWVTPGTFRFSRWWGNRLEAPQPKQRPSVAFEAEDRREEVVFRTEQLAVTVRKMGVLLRVDGADGVPLMADASEILPRKGGFQWEREAQAGTRYFGLGRRADATLDARGRRLRAEEPFLVASRGYAEQHLASGSYTFDLAHSRTDRYGIEVEGADHIEYCFYFGPSIKEMFERRLEVEGPPKRITVEDLGLLAWLTPGMLRRPGVANERTGGGTWSDLRDSLLKLVHGSLSGTLLGEFDLAPFLGSRAELYDRALQLATLVPVLRGAAASSLRRRLTPYLLTYAEEARERGYPIIRSLPFQFPRDAEASTRADQFMLGDELLAAPIYTPDGTRTVYLPQGIWTDFATNEVRTGRRTIRISKPDGGAPPLFARNGSIVPLAPEPGSGPMVLHYFPRLGGEFFIYESDLEDYSQVHAAPAGSYLRLEIESKKTREYEWIVHHVERPKAVSAGLWRYDDALRNLHVGCRARAGEDLIVNIAMPDPIAGGGPATQ